MFKQRNRRTPQVALAGLVAVLALPAAAQAHSVAKAATATCTNDASGVPTVVLSVNYTDFGTDDGTVSGTITLDGVAEPVGPLTWTDDGTYTWTKATTPGTHTISGKFTWPNQEHFNGDVTALTFSCPAPPVTPTAAPPATGAVLPETLASGIARLSGKSGCVKRAFRARVSGRSISAVSFYVDGKPVKTIAAQRAVYSVKVKPGRYGLGRHKVLALVTFATGSGTSPQALPLTFRRCAQAVAAPRFTG